MQNAPVVSRPGFWNSNPQFSRFPMLTSGEKDELAENQTPFQIIGIRDMEHRQYGPTWVLTVDVGAVIRTLFMSRNDGRDEFIQAVRAWIEAGNEPPFVILTTFVTQSGYTAYGFADPGQEYVEGEILPQLEG